MTMVRVNCSRCGATEDLHVIVLGRPCGRLLVYCSACRQRPHIELAFNEPLAVVTPDVVVQLYRDGVTASAPSIAVPIIFGDEVPVGLLDRLLEFVPEG